MASKESKDAHKLPSTEGTKPTASELSSQIQSTSASEVPMTPHPPAGPRTKAKRRAKGRERRYKPKAVSEQVEKMEMEGSGSTSAMPTKNTSADNSDAESGDTIMTDIDDSGQDNLPTSLSANPSAFKQKGDGSSGSDIKEVSTAENTLSLTGAAGSIVSSESSSLSNLSDSNPAVVFKANKLFFEVYSSEAPDGSETAHSLIRSLIAAVSGSLSTDLSVFEAIFKSKRESDYLFYVTELLAKDCIPDKPEAVLVDLLTNLNNFVHFVKEEYLEKVKTHAYSVEHFTNMLKMQEELRRVELKGIMQSNSFPKKGMLLFNIATQFYLLLVQEIVSLKDLPDCEESKSFIKEVTDLLKSCAEFVLGSFNTHWKTRLEGISYVSIRKKSLVDKGKSLKRKHADSQKYELSAIIKDNYCLTGERVNLHQTECDNESMEAETNDLLILANSLRDDYIIERNTELQKSLYFPAVSAATWMKAALKLANPSATEQKVCLTVLHRHALKALEPNGEADFTLQPQTDPVAFYFEKFSNPEVSFDIKRSSMEGLQGYIKSLSKTSYLCACCHADRENGGKTNLMEIACVPEYMVNILRQNKSKFIEKSCAVNVDSS